MGETENEEGGGETGNVSEKEPLFVIEQVY